MLNILGEAGGEEGQRAAHALMGRAYATPGAAVHWYGKAEVAPQRKMGHVTIVARDNAQARARLRAIDPGAADSVDAASARVAELLMAGGGGGGGAAPRVSIIMGSDSDLPTMRAAAEVLEEFGVPCEVTVVSAHRRAGGLGGGSASRAAGLCTPAAAPAVPRCAHRFARLRAAPSPCVHRTPERMFDYARSAHARGVRVIIAGAGGAAHLPGMVAAMTPLPVVGVPVRPAGAHLDGVDALLSIVQMPRGVPVATVAIGNAANAGLLAARILATSDPQLLQRMLAYQQGMTETVLGKAERLEERGWRDY